MTILNRRMCVLGLGASCLLPAVPAWAHRQKISRTTIEWLSESSEIGVTHALHLHDGIRALAMTGKIDTPDLEDVRAKAQLALMIEKQFSLHDESGAHIHLNILGQKPKEYDLRLPNRPNGRPA